jgi:cysteinylglycine-S-conjugate dipeptidase
MAVNWDESLTATCKEMVRHWVSLKPIESNPTGLQKMNETMIHEFKKRGFEVSLIGNPDAPYRPIIIAKLLSSDEKPVIGFFGHYDVEPADSCEWETDPWVLTDVDGRWQGRGVTDNLVPIAQRMLISNALAERANLIFVLQGEEEIGSPFTLATYDSLELPLVDLWIEETGYFYKDGRHRMMVLNRSPKLEKVIEGVIEVNMDDGRTTNIRDRPLNKAFGAENCPCLVHLLKNSPYIALGPNDDYSTVHGINESIDPKLLHISANQLMKAVQVLSDG